MNMEDIKALKAAVECRYNKKITLAKDERKKDLDAIDRVAELQSFSLQPLDNEKQTERTVVAEEKLPLLTADGIREIIAGVDSEFSLPSVRSISKRERGCDVSRNSYHSVVKSKIKNNEVELLHKGGGKKAAVYKKILTEG